MANLPSTLEEMQRDILQGDLRSNPYLQASVIAARDKELKTKAKKIIPAINELLKTVTTFSEGIQSFMEDIKTRCDNMEEAIRELKEESKSIESIEKYDKALEELRLDVDVLLKGCKCINGNGEVEEMKFVEKMKLVKGEIKDFPIGADKLFDVKKQIILYLYDAKSKSYKHFTYVERQVTSSTSIYEFDIKPIELRLNYDTGALKIKNSSEYPVVLYVYEL